jgi:putative Mn2+ efflux pump MntP
MQEFLFILLLAVGLGMDAFSVAISAGAISPKFSWDSVFRLSLSFGLFQFFMPIAGWYTGQTIHTMISRYDHWVAFGLLAYVGGKMIWEGLREESMEYIDPTRGMTLLILSIATSIDALAVGLSLAFLNVPILFPSVVIGMVAFAMTGCGMYFGKQIAKYVGRKVEILGGLILLGIGLKILIEHL